MLNIKKNKQKLFLHYIYIIIKYTTICFFIFGKNKNKINLIFAYIHFFLNIYSIIFCN